MLADALFASPERLLAEQQECYAYMYTYASVTVEVIDPDTERRTHSDRSLVTDINKEVLEASRICKHVSCFTRLLVLSAVSTHSGEGA